MNITNSRRSTNVIDLRNVAPDFDTDPLGWMLAQAAKEQQMKQVNVNGAIVNVPDDAPVPDAPVPDQDLPTVTVTGHRWWWQWIVVGLVVGALLFRQQRSPRRRRARRSV